MGWLKADMIRHPYGLLMLPKLFPRSFNSIVLYSLLLLFFGIGYFLGIAQNIGGCQKSCLRELVVHSETWPAKPPYESSLIILIFSAPQNRKLRDTARRTWLTTKGEHNVHHIFVIASASLDNKGKKSLTEEDQENRDLLFLDTLRDSYSLLSKKLLESFKWISRHFSFTFLLKVDDDSFIRLDALVTALSRQPQRWLYLGFFDGRSPVHHQGKWMEEDWVLCDTYLPYAKGGGYVVTSDIVNFVAKNADFLKLYKSEDVSLGVWLSPLNIKRVHEPNFDTEYKSRGCFNSYLITHKQSETMMMQKYHNLKTIGRLCEKEERKRWSYIYNWKVSPSQCCLRINSTIP